MSRPSRSNKSLTRGLTSQGTECFLNAAAQLAVCCLKHITSSLGGESSPVQELLTAIWIRPSQVPYDSAALARDFRRYSKFKSASQEDAHEALLFILQHIKQSESPFSSLWQQTLTCRNGHESKIHVEEDVLSLPLLDLSDPANLQDPEKQQIQDSVTLQVLLNAYLEDHTISFKCKETPCEDETTADTNKNVRPLQIAKILMLHIIRFECVGDNTRKLMTVVEIPEQLIFGGQSYSIIGNIRHLGKEANSGHYIFEGNQPYVPNDQTKKCYRISDQDVTETAQLDGEGEVYLVAYKKDDIDVQVSFNLIKRTQTTAVSPEPASEPAPISVPSPVPTSSPIVLGSNDPQPPPEAVSEAGVNGPMTNDSKFSRSELNSLVQFDVSLGFHDLEDMIEWFVLKDDRWTNHMGKLIDRPKAIIDSWFQKLPVIHEPCYRMMYLMHVKDLSMELNQNFSFRKRKDSQYKTVHKGQMQKLFQRESQKNHPIFVHVCDELADQLDPDQRSRLKLCQDFQRTCITNRFGYLRSNAIHVSSRWSLHAEMRMAHCVKGTYDFFLGGGYANVQARNNNTHLRWLFDRRHEKSGETIDSMQDKIYSYVLKNLPFLGKNLWSQFVNEQKRQSPEKSLPTANLVTSDDSNSDTSSSSSESSSESSTDISSSSDVEDIADQCKEYLNQPISHLFGPGSDPRETLTSHLLKADLNHQHLSKIVDREVEILTEHLKTQVNQLLEFLQDRNFVSMCLSHTSQSFFGSMKNVTGTSAYLTLSSFLILTPQRKDEGGCISGSEGCDLPRITPQQIQALYKHHHVLHLIPHFNSSSVHDDEDRPAPIDNSDSDESGIISLLSQFNDRSALNDLAFVDVNLQLIRTFLCLSRKSKQFHNGPIFQSRSSRYNFVNLITHIAPNLKAKDYYVYLTLSEILISNPLLVFYRKKGSQTFKKWKITLQKISKLLKNLFGGDSLTTLSPMSVFQSTIQNRLLLQTPSFGDLVSLSERVFSSETRTTRDSNYIDKDLQTQSKTPCVNDSIDTNSSDDSSDNKDSSDSDSESDHSHNADHHNQALSTQPYMMDTQPAAAKTLDGKFILTIFENKGFDTTKAFNMALLTADLYHPQVHFNIVSSEDIRLSDGSVWAEFVQSLKSGPFLILSHLNNIFAKFHSEQDTCKEKMRACGVSPNILLDLYQDPEVTRWDYLMQFKCPVITQSKRYIDILQENGIYCGDFRFIPTGETNLDQFESAIKEWKQTGGWISKQPFSFNGFTFKDLTKSSWKCGLTNSMKLANALRCPYFIIMKKTQTRRESKLLFAGGEFIGAWEDTDCLKTDKHVTLKPDSETVQLLKPICRTVISILTRHIGHSYPMQGSLRFDFLWEQNNPILIEVESLDAGFYVQKETQWTRTIVSHLTQTIHKLSDQYFPAKFQRNGWKPAPNRRELRPRKKRGFPF